MLRTVSVLEKNIQTQVIAPVIISANVNTKVLDDVTGKFEEYAKRIIQNVGANACYYAIGTDCSAVQYNGVLQPGNQLECTLESVNVLSTAGTTVSFTVIMRKDFYPRPNVTSL